MCRWWVVTLILAVVGALIIYWRIKPPNAHRRAAPRQTSQSDVALRSFAGELKSSAAAPGKLA
jgi:hypothetical protein